MFWLIYTFPYVYDTKHNGDDSPKERNTYILKPSPPNFVRVSSA